MYRLLASRRNGLRAICSIFRVCGLRRGSRARSLCRFRTWCSGSTFGWCWRGEEGEGEIKYRRAGEDWSAVNTGDVFMEGKVVMSGMKYVTYAGHDSFGWLKELLFVYAGCMNTSLTA
jgi:hypothetical protein